jgi:hypothetical protein
VRNAKLMNHLNTIFKEPEENNIYIVTTKVFFPMFLI